MAGVLLALNLSLVCEIFGKSNVLLCDEGQMVEAVSAFCYLCGALIMLFRAANLEKAEALWTLFFGVTCLMFFFREMDLRGLNVPPVFRLVGEGTGRNVLFASLFLILTSLIVMTHRSCVFRELRSVLVSPVIRLAMLGCVFLMIGRVFEIRHNQVVEEIFEMNGSVLILFAALIHERIRIRLKTDEPVFV